MIACTKLFVIDEVRLVIFNGVLNFINRPFLLERGQSHDFLSINRLSPFASF
jgi:hypothetical protein